GHGLQDNGLQFRFQGRVQLTRRGHFPFEVLVEDGHGIIATVRWPTREHLIHHDSQAIDICTDIDLTILDLFWRHVQRCTKQRTGPGEPCRGVAYCRSKAKVNDLHYPSITDQHIRWLQVTVNNLNLMGRVHAAADVPEDA